MAERGLDAGEGTGEIKITLYFVSQRYLFVSHFTQSVGYGELAGESRRERDRQTEGKIGRRTQREKDRKTQEERERV